MVCPPVQGDILRALACAFSAVQADKPWYNYNTRDLHTIGLRMNVVWFWLMPGPSVAILLYLTVCV